MFPALLLLAAAPADAEVKSATASGFEVQSVAVVKASPEAAWAMIVKPASWWDPEHSWSGKAGNMTIDPRAGGCFCEAVPPGGSVEHGRVLSAMPGRLLLLEAPLGPAPVARRHDPSELAAEARRRRDRDHPDLCRRRLSADGRRNARAGGRRRAGRAARPAQG